MIPKQTQTSQFIEDLYKKLDESRERFKMDVTTLGIECNHPGMPPLEFDPKAAKIMTAAEVRKFFPRGYYNCPHCRQSVIQYASFQHYIAGDW